MINYPHLAGLVFNTPQYATQNIMASVKAVLSPRLIGSAVDISEVMARTYRYDRAEKAKQEQGIKSPVVVIPIHGILTTRRGMIDDSCREFISYEWLRGAIQAKLDDPEVKEIVLDIYSGGGMATGCKEVADFIYASREIKPITAIVNYHAYSAAYFIASACSKIIVSETSGVGSIGVIYEHMEFSKWAEQTGIKFSTFYRGDHKNDCSPYTELTEQAVEAVNQVMDSAYDIFVSSVAKYRGLDKQQVIDTQAGLYSGQGCIKAGLADEMAAPQDAINKIAAQYPVTTTKKATQSIKLRAASIQQRARL